MSADRAHVPAPAHIGTLNEKPLHAALKAWYAEPGDRLEVPLGGFVIDIVRDDLLIEIQTGTFSALKHKLPALLDAHPLRLVYPIPREKWIVKLDADGAVIGRRRSPKRGMIADVAAQLVSFPALLDHANFTLDVLLTQEDELRQRDESRRAWRRRGWVIVERRLLDVVAQAQFSSTRDVLALLPEALPDPFTTADIAAGLGRPRRLAQQCAYCLRETGVITAVGKRGNAYLYRRA